MCDIIIIIIIVIIINIYLFIYLVIMPPQQNSTRTKKHTYGTQK